MSRAGERRGDGKEYRRERPGCLSAHSHPATTPADSQKGTAGAGIGQCAVSEEAERGVLGDGQGAVGVNQGVADAGR